MTGQIIIHAVHIVSLMALTQTVSCMIRVATSIPGVLPAIDRDASYKDNSDRKIELPVLYPK